MHEMNKCPVCTRILVAHETAWAVDGKIYCSRLCALQELTDKFMQDEKAAERYQDAIEVAKEYFDDCAECISTGEVLAEDLQDVQIAVTFFKTVKVPKCLTREKALEVVEHMWNEGLLLVEPDECDDVQVECELVERHNSSCEEDMNDEFCTE